MNSRMIEEQIGDGEVVFVDLDAGMDRDAGEASAVPRIKLQFTGADRVRYLNGQVSNDVRKLQAAQGSAAQQVCVMNAKGKMNALAWVYATDEALFLNADGALSPEDSEEFREALLMRLERYIIADDVEQSDVTDALAMFHLLGNQEALESDAVRVVLQVAENDGGQWRQARRFGCPGIDLIVPAEHRGVWTERLKTIATSAGAGEIERFRILQGIPRWGKELDENTLPAEAGLDVAAIDFHKGCYIGQEIISRIKSVGRVNRKLVRLSAAAPLEAGMELITEEGQPAGVITSAYHDAAAGRSYALGYHRRGRAESGLSAGNAEEPTAPHRIPVELHPL